ncbi:MAG: sensor histidine kinase [Micropepsaceae bacterium]
MSIWQGVERIREDQQNTQQTLRQSALAAASDELNAFVGAEQFLLALSKQQDIRLGRKTCERRLEDSLRGLALFGNLARIASDGTVLCAAVMPPRNVDPAKFPWWKQALVRREFFVSGPVRSDALRKEVFLGVLPLTNADGVFDGTLNVAIDIQWLTTVHQRQLKLPRGSIVALFDKSGAIVASSAPKVAPAVFAGGAGLPKRSDGVISVTGPNEEPWSLAIAPVLRHEYFIGFAMPDSELTRLSYMSVAIDLLLPVLMILLASLAILMATDRLVVRWLETLGRMATAYGKGDYSTRPQALNEAPQEFRVLGTTLSDMASAVQERDRSLKEALAQKELLVKEIHHRVKNTLQIVLSLLNLQSSRLRDPDAKEAIDQARARINTLAVATRAIDELGLDGGIDLKPLLMEAIEQVQRSAEETHTNVTVSVDLATCKVSGDTAIPLMLFVNEAVTNAYSHGYPEPESGGRISISLRPAGDARMDLVITDEGRGFGTQQPHADTGVGNRLMQALAQQVSGTMTIRNKDRRGTVVELNFAANRDVPAQPV